MQRVLAAKVCREASDPHRSTRPGQLGLRLFIEHAANDSMSARAAQYASCCQSAKSNLARRLCKRWQEGFVKSSAQPQSLEARFLGVFTAAAANEPDQEVVAHLLAVGLDTDANPRGGNRRNDPGQPIWRMSAIDVVDGASSPDPCRLVNFLGFAGLAACCRNAAIW